MFRKLNRAIKGFLREKRLKLGKFLWDRKEKKENIVLENFIEKNKINSILFLRYDGKIGDMIINTLMFREIKKRYPNVKIGVVARGNNKDIIENNKNVDKIYIYEKKSSKIKKLAKEIEKEKYDLLVDFSEMLRVNSMMFIKLCNCRFNIGLDKKGWNLFDLSVNSNEDFKWTDHITERYSAYLRKIGIKGDIDLAYD
ncbi:glycosyltransferase family 9 protein, partial [Fusobacterium mortiferum]|nr:glycosyltransferase family 9 protein [Fusobacterium mortiferum]